MSNHIYIGKIPAYNSRINDSTIQYEKRLLNNLTVTKFEPIAYRINLDLSTAKAAIEGVLNPFLDKNGKVQYRRNAFSPSGAADVDTRSAEAEMYLSEEIRAEFNGIAMESQSI